MATKYQSFLKSLTANATLAKIRAEVRPRLQLLPDNDADRVQEEEGQDFLEDDDGDYDQKRLRKPTRRQSTTLLDALHGFDPTLTECKTDVGCFKLLLVRHLKEFATKDDGTLIVPALQSIQTIVRAMHPVISSQRGYFVDLTYVFKTFFVPRGETSKPTTRSEGPHLYEVRRILHSDDGEVNVYLNQRSDILLAKLSDKYSETWTDCEATARTLYAGAMDPGNRPKRRRPDCYVLWR